MFVEDKGIRDGYIQQKKEYVLIKLSRLVATAIVAPKLVTSIYSTHKLVVEEDTLGTGDGHSGAILDAAKNCTTGCQLCVRGHHSDYSSVLPGSGCHLAVLHRDQVTSVTKRREKIILL